MGNLGRYQDIVVLAKESGGVDAMIDMIKKGAVADAAPILVGAGLAAGAALTVAVPKGYDWIKRTIASRRQTIEDGDTAEQDLRDAIDSDPREAQDDGEDPTEGEVTSSPSDTDQFSEKEDDHANRS